MFFYTKTSLVLWVPTFLNVGWFQPFKMQRLGMGFDSYWRPWKVRILALEDVESPGCRQSEGVFFVSQKLTYPTKREKESHRSKWIYILYIHIYISPEKMYDIVGLEHQVVLNKLFFTTIWRCFLVWGDCCLTFYIFLPCGSLRGVCEKYVRSIVVFNAFIGCKKGMGSKGRQEMRNFNGNLFLRLLIYYLKVRESHIFENWTCYFL